MSLELEDTIAALASAPGAAARGILRISGPDVRLVLAQVIEPALPENGSRLPKRFTGEMGLGEGATLPVEVMFWPTNRSYTGQPLGEIHTIGSPPLLEQALSVLFQHGVRPARAGEFTLRAFLAGRLDLMQAEAVLGVIDAHDHQELETALQQLGGGLSGKIAAVRSDLLDLLSDLEAGLDFVEEDIEFVQRQDLIDRLTKAAETIGRLASQAETRIQSTGQSRVVLAGLPNAGKSCLFNALVKEEAAIVSMIKGTTRDVLRANADLGGLSVEVIDTAGWEAAPTELMQQADDQRQQHSTAADVLLYCIANDGDPAEAELNEKLWTEFQSLGIPTILVRTKSDLPQSLFIPEDMGDPVSLSAMTGEGLDDLKKTIANKLAENRRGARQLIGSTAARCRESLTAAAGSLDEALSATKNFMGDEIVALELHQVLDHLGRILGTVFTDDILDRIFSKFCIGK